MKKPITLVILLCMLLWMTACGSKPSGNWKHCQSKLYASIVEMDLRIQSKTLKNILILMQFVDWGSSRPLLMIVG